MRWLVLCAMLAFPMKDVPEFVDVQEQAVEPADDLSRAFDKLTKSLRKLERLFDENEKLRKELDSSLDSLNRRLQQ